MAPIALGSQQDDDDFLADKVDDAGAIASLVDPPLRPLAPEGTAIADTRQLWFVVNSIVSGMDRPSESPTGEERSIRSRNWRICSSSAPGASRTIV